MSDAQHYRTKEEVEEYKKIDPIFKVKDLIIKKYLTTKEIESIDKKVKDRFDECERLLKTLPFLKNQFFMILSMIKRLSFYKT